MGVRLYIESPAGILDEVETEDDFMCFRNSEHRLWSRASWAAASLL